MVIDATDTRTPQEKTALLIYHNILYWILLNAKEAGWFDAELPLETMLRAVQAGARAALTKLLEKEHNGR